MNTADVYFTILAAFVGFVVLAVVLLYPVARFIAREEEAGDAHTRRLTGRDRPPGGDGAPGDGATGSAPPPAPAAPPAQKRR